jgi:hypothetical protein
MEDRGGYAIKWKCSQTKIHILTLNSCNSLLHKTCQWPEEINRKLKLTEESYLLYLIPEKTILSSKNMKQIRVELLNLKSAVRHLLY